MRKGVFWIGWAILLLLPAAFLVEIWIIQDLPTVQPWKWILPAAALAMIYFARNTDDVLKHHVV